MAFVNNQIYIVKKIKRYERVFCYWKKRANFRLYVII